MGDRMEEKRDIFDRIMSLRLLRPLQPFFNKYREPLLYMLFGGLTTLLSIASFWLLTSPLGMDALLANPISWVVSVAFAYVTNRTWVFGNKASGASGVTREALSFALGRLATLGLEELILWAGIDMLGFPALPVKLFAQVIVILGNYVISKLFVFRKP